MPVVSTAPETPKIRIYPMVFQTQKSFFILPEDLIKVIRYKVDNALDQQKKIDALRILINFRKDCKEKHTIPFQEANEILVKLEYLSTPSTDTDQLIVEDPEYKKAMDLFETDAVSSPVIIIWHSGTKKGIVSSQVLFHLFRTFVCGINWKSNCCSEHSNCLQDYKQAVLTCMRKYHDRDGKLHDYTVVQIEIANLKNLCYYKNMQGYLSLWVPLKGTSLLDHFYGRMKTRFELPDFFSDINTGEICHEHKFHLMKMCVYEGWMFNFFGFEHTDLWATIFDAIALTLPRPIFCIAILRLDAAMQRLKEEAENSRAAIEQEGNTPADDIPNPEDNQHPLVLDEEQEVNTGSGTESDESDEEDTEESEDDQSEEGSEQLLEEMNTLRIAAVQNDEVVPAQNEQMDHDANSERNEQRVAEYMQQLAERLPYFGRTAAHQEMIRKLSGILRRLLQHQDRPIQAEEQIDEKRRINEILRSRDSLRPAGDSYDGRSAFHVVRNHPESQEDTCSHCKTKIEPDVFDLILDCKECSSVFHSACHKEACQEHTLTCSTCERDSLTIRETELFKKTKLEYALKQASQNQP